MLMLMLSACALADGEWEEPELIRGFWGEDITGGVSQSNPEVVFPDEMTNIRVHVALGKKMSEPITKSDLEWTTQIYIHDLEEVDGISFGDDLSFLSYFPNLKELTIRNCGLKTLPEVICDLPLEKLDLEANDLRDISALANNQSVRELNLSGNNFLVDIGAIGEMESLERLSISGFSLKDFSALTESESLKEVYIACQFMRNNTSYEMFGSSIPDLSFVEKMKCIEVVSVVGYPEVTDENRRIAEKNSDVIVLRGACQSVQGDLLDEVERGLTYMLDGLDPQDVLDFYHNQ